MFPGEVVFGKGVAAQRANQCASHGNRSGVKERVAKPTDKNPVSKSEQVYDVFKEVRRIGEPEPESRENLTTILGHGRQDPSRRQDAIENEDREDGMTKCSGEGTCANMGVRDRLLPVPLKRADLSPGPMCEGDWSAKSGYLAALELIRHHRGNFTALVTANDHRALGALSAFHRNGIAVPDEISVIGYDGMPESEFYQPSLTTIYQDFAALGEMSVEFLLRMIN